MTARPMTEGEREKLERCPFCQSETGAMMRQGGAWRVWCLRPASVCGYIGPDKATEAEAVAHHNRALLSTSSEVRGMREALMISRGFVVAALEAHPDMKGLDVNDHLVVREIDAALSAEGERERASSEVRRLREALEGSLISLLPMARAWVDTVHAPNDKIEVERVAQLLCAALSLEGEDELARGQGRSAPISTDTKDTTK